MLTLRKNSLKYKDENGVMQDSGVLFASDEEKNYATKEELEQLYEEIGDVKSKFVRSNEASWIEQDYTYIEGRFLHNDGAENVLGASAYALFDVRPGEKCKITTVGGENVPYACFYSSNIVSSDTLVATTGSLSKPTIVTDYEVIVPDNAVLMGVNNRYYTDSKYLFGVKKYEILEYDFAEILNQVEDISKEIDEQRGEIKFVPQDYSFVGGKFLGIDGSIGSVQTAAYALFNVQEGEQYLITTIGGTNVPYVSFYNSYIIGRNTLISNTGDLAETTKLTAELITVPENAVVMGVNHRYYESTSSYPFSVEKKQYKGYSDFIADVEYEVEQLERRVIRAEHNNEWCWGKFDKAYFVFIHDDTNSFLTDAYSAFHEKGVPLGAATISTRLFNTIGDTTAKDILDGIVADGGEVLCHYDYDLLNETEDDVWYEQVVTSKRLLEDNGYTVRGLILANSSDLRSAKGEKFCRRYYDYADKVGTSLRFNLGRTLMLNFDTLDEFKARIDTLSTTPGLYAFGFHGNRTDEAWITQESLCEIIDYINAKNNCEITTYGNVFDAIGTTVLEKRLTELENAK